MKHPSRTTNINFFSVPSFVETKIYATTKMQ